jgi:hypothetical protein
MFKFFLFISLFSIAHNMLFCMDNNKNKFAVIKCIDGEVQLPFSQVQKFPFVMPETDAIDFDLTKIRPSLNAETFKLLRSFR